MIFKVSCVSGVSLTIVSYGCALPTQSIATTNSIVTVGFLNGGATSITGASLVQTDSNAIVTTTPLATILPGTELKHSVTLAYNGARRVEYVKLVVVDGSATTLGSQTILCQWNDQDGAQFTRTHENGPSSSGTCGIMCILTIILAGIFSSIGVASVVFGFIRGYSITDTKQYGYFTANNTFVPPVTTPHMWTQFPITLPVPTNHPSLAASISRLLARRV